MVNTSRVALSAKQSSQSVVITYPLVSATDAQQANQPEYQRRVAVARFGQSCGAVGIRLLATLGITNSPTPITAMSPEDPDLSSIRRIRDALDVGAAEAGELVILNLRMEDGSTEWFAIQHLKVGRLISGIMFASAAAARDRPKATPGGNQMPELSTLIDMTGFNASANPGADFVVLRIKVGEGVNLDFRIPIESLAAMQERLALALQVAQSGTAPSAH